MRKLVLVRELSNRPLAEMARRHLQRFGIYATFDNRFTTPLFELPDSASPIFGLLVNEDDVVAAQDLLLQILPPPGSVDMRIDENFDVGLADDSEMD